MFNFAATRRHACSLTFFLSLAIAATSSQTCIRANVTGVAKDAAESYTMENDPTSSNLTIVTSSITDAEHMVTNGQYKLRSRAPVMFASKTAASRNSK